eukprot:580652-Amorphochlora_amoeboformis.AAC.1
MWAVQVCVVARHHKPLLCPSGHALGHGHGYGHDHCHDCSLGLEEGLQVVRWDMGVGARLGVVEVDGVVGRFHPAECRRLRRRERSLDWTVCRRGRTLGT